MKYPALKNCLIEKLEMPKKSMKNKVAKELGDEISQIYKLI